MANEEYIERNSLLKEVKQIEGVFAAPLIIRKIEEAKAEDVVAVVRCKDCRHRKEELNINDELELMCGFNYGLRVRGTVSPDDFCSYGKRKEGIEE